MTSSSVPSSRIPTTLSLTRQELITVNNFNERLQGKLIDLIANCQEGEARQRLVKCKEASISISVELLELYTSLL